MPKQNLQDIKQRYDIVGNCDALNRALEVALRVSSADFSVLIQGENGVGKEVIPRIIHDASPRKNKKYLALNCGAIPEGTIDSELFGHVRGAFTGSVESREGYFAAADGGTLFLDEVGELPLQTQVRLLRVLETGEFIPVGSSEVRRTNVRIVAATNVDMSRAIREGRFREDLFYRLAAVRIEMPPLRKRGDDIDKLFRKFALEMSERSQRPPIRLNDAAREKLLAYPWPGNVRQLKNVAEGMSVLLDEREITPELLARFIPVDELHTQLVLGGSQTPSVVAGTVQYDQDRDLILQMIALLRREVEQLRAEVHQIKGGVFSSNESSSRGALLPYHSSPTLPIDDVAEAEEIHDDEWQSQRPQVAHVPTKDDVEKELIRTALIRCGGHRKQAADQIGISERTLYRKIKEYGLDDL